jgi:hypothetical protein
MNTCAALVLNSFTSAIFLFSALNKLIAPRHLRAAIADVLPSLRHPGATSSVVAAAVFLEILDASLLVGPSTQLIGVVLLSILALGITAFGLLGKLHHSSVACGCFGSLTSTPVGLANIIMGGLFIIVAIFDGASLAAGLVTPVYPAVRLLFVAVCLLLLSIFTHWESILLVAISARRLSRGAALRGLS